MIVAGRLGVETLEMLGRDRVHKIDCTNRPWNIMMSGLLSAELLPSYVDSNARRRVD